MDLRGRLGKEKTIKIFMPNLRINGKRIDVWETLFQVLSALPEPSVKLKTKQNKPQSFHA